MPSPVRLALIAACAALLAACGEWQADTSALTARSASAPRGADCASCHRYPLLDTNHAYHLFRADPDKRVNGPITCLDCHARSLQFATVTVRDSFYTDTTGENQGVWSTVDFPTTDPADTLAVLVRTWRLDSVVLRPQHRPLPLPQRPGAAPNLAEYMTGLAHLNGTVDVEFDPRVSDTVRFPGQRASFNPTQETCSAVACHPGDKPFRFAAPSKGLPRLPTPEE